jgi:hypothetical protein
MEATAKVASLNLGAMVDGTSMSFSDLPGKAINRVGACLVPHVVVRPTYRR